LEKKGRRPREAATKKTEKEKWNLFSRWEGRKVGHSGLVEWGKKASTLGRFYRTNAGLPVGLKKGKRGVDISNGISNPKGEGECFFFLREKKSQLKSGGGADSINVREEGYPFLGVNLLEKKGPFQGEKEGKERKHLFLLGGGSGNGREDLITSPVVEERPTLRERADVV